MQRSTKSLATLLLLLVSCHPVLAESFSSSSADANQPFKLDLHDGNAAALPANDLTSRPAAFMEHLTPHHSDEPSTEESVDPTRAPTISLQDAIVLSLTHNPDLRISKLVPAEAAQRVLAAEGALDTYLEQNTSYSRIVDPNTFPSSQKTVTNLEFDANLGLKQKLPTGGDLSVDWKNVRSQTSNPFTSLSPYEQSGITLGLSQPLLKGTGWGTPGVTIRLNKRLESAALKNYQAALAEHIRQVIVTYLAEVQAKQVVDVRQRSLELAQRLRKDMEQSVKVGLLPPLSLSDAEAQVALRTEELISANNDLLNSGRKLRQIVGSDFDAGPNGELDTTPYATNYTPKFFQIAFDEKESVKTALARRPELEAQQYNLKAAELSSRLAENALLPQLNLQGALGSKGLAGDQAKDSVNFGEPLINQFPGSYTDAWRRLNSGDYYNYQVGLTLQFPFENRQAQAQANLERIALMREQSRLRSLRQSIIEEVLRNVANLEAAKKRVKAADEAVKFSTQAADVAEKKLNAGLGTVREVLEAQRDLSSAEQKQATALTDFLVAVADVYKGRGEILSEMKVAY